MSQDKPYDNLLSFLDKYYPDESPAQTLTFSNYPHLQKIADLLTDLLNESQRRKLKKDETQLAIRAISTLINENNDISVSEIQTHRVAKRKQLGYDSELDDPEVMREQIIELHQQIAVYSTEIKNHQNQVDSLREEIAELRDENDNLQKKFNLLKRTREEEVSKLTVQKEGIGDQYKTAMLDLRLETDKGLNLSAQIDSMMKETNEKDEDIEKLQQKNKEQKDLLRKAKSLLKTLESRITEDKTTINRLNNQISKLNNQVKTLKSRTPSKKKIEKDNLSLKNDNKALQDRAIELTVSNEKNLQTITDLINENQRISQLLMTLTSQKENDEKEAAQSRGRDDNSNQDIRSNKSDQSKSTQKNSTPKHSNQNQTKSPVTNRNCSNLSDFVENSSSTFNDAFESGNTKNSATRRSENNESVKGNNNDNDNDNDKNQEMEQSLKKIASLFKKSNIRPSQLPIISKTLQDQENLLNKFRSTIDAQARFITRLLNEDYVAPHLLSISEPKKNADENQNEKENEEPKSDENNDNANNDNADNVKKEYPTSSVFKDEKLKEFVLKAVEDTRQVAYESLNGSSPEFDEIVLYDSIFDPDEGADLLVAEQESRGADNELAALAILLSIIIKQRKICESDAKFLQSIYKNMSLDFDHPASAEDASNYIDNIHKSIKQLRKFYNSEYERIDPEKDNADFLTTFTTNINEFTPSIKESAGYKGKLIDLPDYLTSSANRNAQNRSANLTESGNNSNKQRNSTRSTSRNNNNNNNNENNEEDYDEVVNLNSFSSPGGSDEEESAINEIKERNLSSNNNNQNLDNEEDDDSIFGERINSVPAGNSSTSNTNKSNNTNNDAKVRKLREEINNYKNEIKTLNRQLDEANSISEALQEAFNSYRIKNEETEANAMVIIGERDRLQNLLDERDKQFDKRIKNVTNHIQDQKEQEIKILKKRYEDENKLLAQKVDSRDKRLREIKKSMKEIIGMYEDLLTRQREEMRELSKKNEETENEPIKDNHRQRNEDNKNSKKIDELQHKIADLQDKISNTADLVIQRSNDLSLTATSANNSLSLENPNTQSARRSTNNTQAYTRPNGNNTYNTRSNYRNYNNNNNAYNRQNNYDNKNFSPTSVNRNYNQDNNRVNNNYSFNSRNTNNNNLSLNSSNRNNSGTSF